MTIKYDGKKHLANPYVELHISDDHAEYPLPGPGCKIIFDFYDLEDLFGEAKAEELQALLSPEFDEAQYIWRVTGKIGELEQLFTTYATEICKGPRGADDDTYDYWPSAFTVCEQLATDLDTLTETETHMDFLIAQYQQMIKNIGEVPEFQPSWED